MNLKVNRSSGSNHSLYIHLHPYLLPVWNAYQERSAGLSPPAATGPAQPPTAAPGPASLFPSEAQARWAKRQWEPVPASTWGPGRPCAPSVLPLGYPLHVQSPAAPQGGGPARLRGDGCLLFLPSFLFSLSLCLLFNSPLHLYTLPGLCVSMWHKEIWPLDLAWPETGTHVDCGPGWKPLSRRLLPENDSDCTKSSSSLFRPALQKWLHWLCSACRV